MANFDGVNYANRNTDEPKEKVNKGELNGRLRMLYDERDVSSDTIANTDKILLGGKLPAGARVVQAILKIANQGATGILDLGWQANGVDAADQNGIINQADAGGQDVHKLASDDPSVPGLLKKFTVETQLEATCTEDFATEAGTVQMAVYYVVD